MFDGLRTLGEQCPLSGLSKFFCSFIGLTITIGEIDIKVLCHCKQKYSTDKTSH